MSEAGDPVVAVDWGTSSVRAWVLGGDGASLAETRSADGMNVTAVGGFEAVLRARLADLGSALDGLPHPLPVVLCGMVGARQGWVEAAYVDAPTPLAALADRAVPVAADGLDARILPGLASRAPGRPDVLRGEETQLLGLVLGGGPASGLVAMPGTHSKWVTLEDGVVAGFTTAMTGELFALLAERSILRHTIGGARPSGDPDAPAFTAGLADGLGDPAGVHGRLFALRAADLLDGIRGAEAADRLSGLLIGSEVAGHLGEAGPVVLVASGRLAALYRAALETAGRPVEVVDAETAVRAGLHHAARRLWPATPEDTR